MTVDTVDIPYTEDILASAGMSRSELAETARIAVAARLFADGRLSMGQAARFCGLGRVEFMAELVRCGYSCVNLGPDDADDESRFAHDG